MKNQGRRSTLARIKRAIGLASIEVDVDLHAEQIADTVMKARRRRSPGSARRRQTTKGA